MKTIKVEELSHETFFEYGSYSNMLQPSGYYLGDIPARVYRDRVVANYDPTSVVAFGVNEVYPREKNLIEKTEHHFNTEIFLLRSVQRGKPPILTSSAYTGFPKAHWSACAPVCSTAGPLPPGKRSSMFCWHFRK